jgi:hypothetical protein
MIISHTFKNNDCEGIVFYEETDGVCLTIANDLLNNKVIIDHWHKGKDYLKQAICKLIDEAEEVD